MEIRSTQLHYLLAVYELDQQPKGAGTAEIARLMKCSKASASNMMTTLMKHGLLVKERYGKAYLTDTGYLLVKDAHECMVQLKKHLHQIDICLTEDEVTDVARMMVTILPEHCLQQLREE